MKDVERRQERTMKALDAAANNVNRAMIKNRSLRWMWAAHNLVLYALIIICVVTGGLYIKESTVKFEDAVDVRAVVASKSEFEGDEPISFYFIGRLHPETARDFSLDSTLRCDDGFTGSKFISADSVLLTDTNTISNPDAFRTLDEFIVNTRDTQTYTQLASSVRLITKTLADVDEDPIVFKGKFPTEISTCVTEHTITAKTPIFGLELTDTIQSYPFDYVWYGDSARDFLED